MLGGKKSRSKGHRALVAEFDWSRARQAVRMWTPPKALDLPKQLPKHSGELDLSYMEASESRSEEMEGAFEREDSEEALQTWHNLSESWLWQQTIGDNPVAGPRPHAQDSPLARPE